MFDIVTNTWHVLQLIVMRNVLGLLGCVCWHVVCLCVCVCLVETMEDIYMERRTRKNTYYKDYGDGKRFMSGLPLPRDTDGTIRNVDFVDCTFHPGCVGPIENCTFTNCSGDRYLKG